MNVGATPSFRARGRARALYVRLEATPGAAPHLREPIHERAVAKEQQVLQIKVTDGLVDPDRAASSAPESVLAPLARATRLLAARGATSVETLRREQRQGEAASA